MEVADTSLKKDLELKKSFYAAANIPEYWVLDLAGQKIHVFLNPQGDDYLNYQIWNQGELVSLAFPDLPVTLEKLF
ncbi:MAG: Uma2 family endonuclease [Xenococcus sp. (in: cyanobacteria)]